MVKRALGEMNVGDKKIQDMYALYEYMNKGTHEFKESCIFHEMYSIIKREYMSEIDARYDLEACWRS